ncbi:MAG: hypothetical protein JRM99_03950 [Nitrososphaerota archaeon]|jgi:hypothetical protein|nr:hypothetical protein [Nitrososphaerota archaeon]MDG6974266.1 hypothetical protein [Nitrososphaerota archaeon]MDG6990555.1 hypothetical protein [Nitrososphaerota archaeon]
MDLITAAVLGGSGGFGVAFARYLLARLQLNKWLRDRGVTRSEWADAERQLEADERGL